MYLVRVHLVLVINFLVNVFPVDLVILDLVIVNNFLVDVVPVDCCRVDLVLLNNYAVKVILGRHCPCSFDSEYFTAGHVSTVQCGITYFQLMYR